MDVCPDRITLSRFNMYSTKQNEQKSAAMSPSVELERQRAFRIILQKPLLTSNGPDAENYRLIRAHAQWLKEWFARNAEWNFQLDTEVARLRKTPSDLNDSTRGAVNSKGIAFSRRRYVLLC